MHQDQIADARPHPQALKDCRLDGEAFGVAPLCFLRQPSKPNAPRPVAKSGNAAGSGTAGKSKVCAKWPPMLPLKDVTTPTETQSTLIEPDKAALEKHGMPILPQ
jgi:hypothetical protein